MSTFDDASLVFIPSGYKTSKAYSVKPSDGSGDLAFSRSNDTATRVNSAGLIEKVRTNVLTYSNDFSNAAYAKQGVTLTSGQADPFGGTSAWKLELAAGVSYLGQGGFTNTLRTASIWMRADAATTVGFSFGNTTTGSANVTTTWQRFTFTANETSGIQVDNYFGVSPANQPKTVYIFQGQVENGDIATDYIATTSAAVSVGPVANVPRLDYLNSSCPRLLLEPQRTNLALYSEAFGTASYWYANNATITSNSVVSPDGYTNADTYTAAGANNYLNGSATSAGSNTVTFSVFVKAGTVSQFRLRESYYYGTSTVFNIANGTVIAGTGTITSYGNGWYRCTHTQTYGAGEVNLSWTYDLNTASSGTAYIYGAMAEVGAYATSYIPTLGAAVTRGADFASKTSASALIGQTEGTLYAEFTRLNVGNAVVLFQTNDGTSNNRAQIEISTSGAAIGVALSGGALTCLIIGPTLALGQTHKVAISYKANDFKLYVNGVLAGTDTSGAVPVSMNRIDLASELGTSYGGVSVSQILNFPTALSSAQLAELTA